MGIPSSPIGVKQAPLANISNLPPPPKKARLDSLLATKISFMPTAAIGGAGIDTGVAASSVSAAGSPHLSASRVMPLYEKKNRLKHPGIFDMVEEKVAKSVGMEESKRSSIESSFTGKSLVGDLRLPADPITGGFAEFTANPDLRVLDRRSLPLNSLPTIFGSYESSLPSMAVSGHKRPRSQISPTTEGATEAGLGRDLFGGKELLEKGALTRQKESDRLLDQKKRLYEKIQRILETSEITNCEGKQFTIVPIRGAFGQHSQVYTLRGSELFIPDKRNDEIVIKTYQETTIKNPENNPFRLMQTSLKQYKELVGKLPITSIYNPETALDDGFFVVERIIPFEIPWDKTTTKEEIRAKYLKRLDELKSFFDFARTHPSTIPLDLKKSNFGINSEGKLVLSDFMEHEEEDDPYAFRLIDNSCLESVANGNSYVEEYLRRK